MIPSQTKDFELTSKMQKMPYATMFIYFVGFERHRSKTFFLSDCNANLINDFRVYLLNLRINTGLIDRYVSYLKQISKDNTIA